MFVIFIDNKTAEFLKITYSPKNSDINSVVQRKFRRNTLSFQVNSPTFVRNVMVLLGCYFFTR